MFKIHHQASVALFFFYALHVHTARMWVFFTIVLGLWDLVHAKIYKFEIRKRGLVVKLASLT